MRRFVVCWMAMLLVGSACTVAAPASPDKASSSAVVTPSSAPQTTNGSPTSSSASVTIRDIEVVDGGAWVLGDNGVKVKSSEAGAGWRNVQLPAAVTFGQIGAIGASSATQAWLAAPNQDGGILAFQTSDAGVSWTNINFPASYEAGDSIAIRAISSMEAWFELTVPLGTESAGTLFHTTDGGRSWSGSKGMPLAGIVAFNGDTGWAAVGPAHSRLFFTSDGADSWSQVKLTPPPGDE